MKMNLLHAIYTFVQKSYYRGKGEFLQYCDLLMMTTDYVHLYYGVRLRQRVHNVTISCSAVIHAECLPIEPRSTAHTMGFRRERLHLVQPPLCNGS